MSDYQLTVTRQRKNPDYDAELTEWKRQRQYNHFDAPGPPLEIQDERVLSVHLTEEEFLAVKRGVLEVFK